MINHSADGIALSHSFDDLYRAISQQPNKQVKLYSAGGTKFTAIAHMAHKAKGISDKRCIIARSQGGDARIYSCCWGYKKNHSGTLIGQYVPKIDKWLPN